MFKANRKITQSIELCKHDIKFKEFDMVYLQNGELIYLINYAKPTIVRVELSSDDFDLMINCSKEIETYDYDRSRVAQNRLKTRTVTREEKIKRLKENQKKEKTKTSKQQTSFERDIEPHLENIKKMTYDGVSRKKIAMMLGLSYSSINQYMIRYKELKDALTKI